MEDLELDVKGCRNVYASFDKYVEKKHLIVDNEFHAEEYGYKEAEKGVRFIDFPSVLLLHLKRFDYTTRIEVEINDLYEFPVELDLDRENGKYLSPDTNRGVRNLYTLHRFKFEDKLVTKENMKGALEEQYDGEEKTNPGSNDTTFKVMKSSRADILIYIRENDKEKILCDVDEKDIAEHLRKWLKKEQEENEHKKKEKEHKKKEMAETHLCTIKVARDEDLLDQIGKKKHFDLVDHDQVSRFRIEKQMPFNNFKKVVAKSFGVPEEFQRFWLWAKRRNRTYRPDRPLTHREETQPVGQLMKVSDKAHNAALKLFLEVELGPDLRPIGIPENTEEDIMLFFKLFDPQNLVLWFVGRLFVKCNGKPSEILTQLNEMAGFSPNEEIELYEVVHFQSPEKPKEDQFRQTRNLKL